MAILVTVPFILKYQSRDGVGVGTSFPNPPRNHLTFFYSRKTNLMALAARFQKITGLPFQAQTTLLTVTFGHGATHWMGTAFYMLLSWVKDDLSLSYLAVGSLVAVMHFSAF